MYGIPSWAIIGDMGYALSRLEIGSDCDGDMSINAAGEGQVSNNSLNNLDDEIAQLTRMKSGPSAHLGQVLPGKREVSVSPVKMLAGRECNYSGKGRFSAGDCCHVLSRYLPVNGPWLVDQMASRAYVSQFSSDGSLFVAGFQVPLCNPCIKCDYGKPLCGF